MKNITLNPGNDFIATITGHNIKTGGTLEVVPLIFWIQANLNDQSCISGRTCWSKIQNKDLLNGVLDGKVTRSELTTNTSTELETMLSRNGNWEELATVKKLILEFDPNHSNNGTQVQVRL